MPRSSDSSLLFKVLTFVVLWTSCLTASPVLSAQERGGCGNDPVVFSQRFLRAVYPELQDKNQSVSMVLHAGGPFTTPWSILSQFEVQVRKYPVGAAPAGVIDSDGKGHEVHNDVLAGGFFMCASEKPRLNSYVYKFVGGGTVTGRDAWEAFVKSSDAHPEWSDEETVKTMKGAGALYGPNDKDAFLKQTNIPALEPFLGKLRILKLDFQVRDESDDNHPSVLAWIVRVETQQSQDNRREYTLFFEPFRGKLYLLTR